MTKLLNKIQMSINYNKFFFELKRIPIIKGYVSNYVYDRYDKKTHWFFSPYLGKNILKLFTKTFYLFLILGITALINLYLEDKHMIRVPVDIFIFIWFVFLVIGSLNYETGFSGDSVKIYLMSFRLPFKDYYQLQIKELLWDRIIYGIVILVGVLVFKVDFMVGILMFMTLGMMLFYRLGKNIHASLSSKKLKGLPVFLGMFFVVSAYFLRMKWTLILVIGYFMLWFLWAYRKYRNVDVVDLYHRTFLNNFKEHEGILDSMDKMTVESVSIKKTDDLEYHDFNIDDVKGYDLFNQLFITRLSFIWKKQFRIYQLVLLAGFSILLGVLLVLPQYRDVIFKVDLHTRLINMYLFFLYITEIGKTLTQAYYFNADYSLLHYPFYFEQKNLWRQFLVRLKTVFGLHLRVGGLLIVFTALYTSLFSDYMRWDMQFKFLLVVVLLMLFVSVFDLALYYLLQPFTKNLKTKSKVYVVLYTLVYLILYGLEIDIQDKMQVVLVASISGIFFVVSLLLVYLFAHKTFKYKE